MISYSVKQDGANLKVDNIVTLHSRPNLRNALYQGQYLGYARAMDNYVGRGGRIVVSFSQQFGIYLTNGCYYPCFLLDKVETYNPEEDI